MAFQTLNVTNAGRRGRPSHPRTVEGVRSEQILSETGAELGELHVEAGKGGAVLVTVVTPKGEQVVTIPGKRVAPAKGRKVSKARKARKASK